MLAKRKKAYTPVSVDMKLPSETGRQTTKPIPTRFFENDAIFINQAVAETGLPAAELIRRSIRLMKYERELKGTYGFVMELAS